jgi:cation transport ATPase
MGVESTVSKEGRQEVSFTVLAIDCILCSPLLRRSLAKIEGVLEFKELPFTNKIIVAFDPSRLEREALIQEITKISQRAGLGGKIVFHR